MIASEQRRSRAALFAALLAASCSDAPSEPGLHFESDLADVGRMFAGPSVALKFPFVNGPEAVVIDSVETSCGCLEPEIWLGGTRLPLPVIVPPGARGEVRTEYRTEGFSGRKKSGLTLHGSGPGMPVVLRVDSILDTWITADPPTVQFGVVDGLTERIARVVLRGPEAFRLTAPIGGAPGVQVRGAPSEHSAREHVVEVVLEASQEEGPHAAFLNLGADNGWSVRLPVAWDLAGPLYLIPHRLLPLGRVRPGVAVSAAIEVGVREGSLELPDVLVVDLAGVKTTVRTLQESSRYRIDLTLPDDLPAGAFSGRVQIVLRHTHDGVVEEIRREVRLLGVVQAESTP